MSLTEKQKANYAQFFYTTLNQVGRLCPEVIENEGSLGLLTSWKGLLKCSRSLIETPYNRILESIYGQPSSLIDEDEFIEPKQVIELFASLQSKGRVLRLNHVGFVYMTNSIKSEIEYIQEVSRRNALQTVRLDSHNPQGDPIWIFVGDTANWREPMLEFVPLEEKVKEKEIDYVLPHLHISIDTTLSFEDISDSILSVLKGKRSISANYYDGYVTQARVWVGVVSGINLHLDIGTFAQNTRYVRKVLLEPLSS